MSQGQLQQKAILELVIDNFLKHITRTMEAKVAHKNWDQHSMLQTIHNESLQDPSYSS
jgi:hypothetical protein